MNQPTNEYDKTKLCRACASEERTLQLFFSDVLCENKSVKVSHMFENVTSIPCSEDDVYPTRICETCVDSLISAYSFKQKCLAIMPILQKKIFALKSTNNPIYLIDTNNVSLPVAQVTLVTSSYINHEGTATTSNVKGSKTHSTTEPKKCSSIKKNANVEDLKSCNENVTANYLLLPCETSVSSSKDPNQSSLLENSKSKTQITSNVTEMSSKITESNLDVLSGTNPNTSEISKADSNIQTEVNKGDDEMQILASETGNAANKPSDIYDTIEIDTDDDDDVVLVVEKDILADIEPKYDEVIRVETNKRKMHINSRTSSLGKKYKNPYKCTACPVSYELPDDLMIHTINIHADSGPFLCPYLDCPMTCCTLVEYKLHREKHTGNKLVDMKCEICDSVFHNLYEFNKHKRKHEREKRFKCDVCRQQFVFRKEIRTHILEHSKSMFQENEVNTVKYCNLCPHLGPFGSSDKIFQHLYYEHISIIYYTCGTCSETFAIQSSLAKHICKPEKSNPTLLNITNIDGNIIVGSLAAAQTKTNISTENEFILPDLAESDVPVAINNVIQEISTSEQSTYNTQNENRSKEIKYEEPPIKKVCAELYTCTICLSSFVIPDGLMLHMLTNHADCGTFLCPYPNCLVACSSMEEYKSHRETHEEKNMHTLKSTAKFKCDICNIIFYKSSDLYKHTRKHNTTKRIHCDVCQQDIFNESVAGHVRNHSKAMHENLSDMCGLCLQLGPFESVERLYHHLLSTHTKESFYHCNICPTSFSEKKLFSKHMRSHEDPSLFQICSENSPECSSVKQPS